MAAGDPAFAHGVRDIEGAMHHDIGDGVKAARAEILRARDEISGRVVDQIGERSGGENIGHHGVDSRRVADIEAEARYLAAMSGYNLGGGLIANALAPAADE